MTLKLNPAKSELIGRFIESYLELSAEELKRYDRAFATLPREEQEATMELMTSWKREGLAEGRQEGRQEGLQEGLLQGRQKGLKEGRQEGLKEGQQKGLHEGKEELLVLMIEQRFGSVAPEIRKQLETLSSEALNELGKAFLHFTSVAELESWLSANRSQ